MKKFLTFAAVAVILASGCKKYEAAEAGSTVPSSNPTEKNKQLLEDNFSKMGELAAEMQDAKALTGFAALASMSDQLGTILPMDMLPSGLGDTDPLNSLSFNNNQSILKADKEEAKAPEMGTYRWSASKQKFVHTPGGDKVVVLFPVPFESTSNKTNGELTYSFSIPSKDDMENGKMSAKVSVTLNIDGRQEASYFFSAQASQSALTASIGHKLTIGDFAFSQGMSASTSRASTNMLCQMKGETLAAYRFGGEFETDAIKDVKDPSKLLDTAPNTIVKSAEAYLQLMDIAFTGKSDVSALRKIDGGSLSKAEQAALLNKHIHCQMIQVSSGKTLATLRFAVQEGTLKELIVFPDGSSTDLETYSEKTIKPLFDTMFDDLSGGMTKEPAL